MRPDELKDDGYRPHFPILVTVIAIIISVFILCVSAAISSWLIPPILIAVLLYNKKLCYFIMRTLKKNYEWF